MKASTIRAKLIKLWRDKTTIGQDEWFELVAESYKRPPVSYKEMVPPGFPPDPIQINTTGQAGVDTLKEAFVFYQDCTETFATLFRHVHAGAFLVRPSKTIAPNFIFQKEVI